MKNYELIAELMELPAGYDMTFSAQATKEDLGNADQVFVGGTVLGLEVREDERTIELTC